MRTKPYKVLRWILRGLSGLFIAFFILMFIPDFGSESGNPLTANAILQLSVTGIGLIGLGLAWKWELIGGIIASAAFVVLAIINPSVLKGLIVVIWPLTGILFIVLWALCRKSTVKNR